MPWIKLGEVGVDSGQLVVMDPCYIGEATNSLSDGFFTVHFWGQAESEIRKRFGFVSNRVIRHTRDEAEQLATHIRTAASGLKQVIVINIEDGDFYDQCCRATGSDVMGGEINYPLGHPGLAVAFQSGMGDGHYEVWVKTEDVGGGDQRVVEVRIKLTNEEDLEGLEETEDVPV